MDFLLIKWWTHPSLYTLIISSLQDVIMTKRLQLEQILEGKGVPVVGGSIDGRTPRFVEVKFVDR